MLSYISPLFRAWNLSSDRRNLVVLGSTGSIGRNVLRVVGESPRMLRLVGLAAGRNVRLLAEQAAQWRPSCLAVYSEEHRRELLELLPSGYRPHIYVGQEGYEVLASLAEADIVVSSLVGAAGLAPTLRAVKCRKVVALANKESLVLAGPLLREACLRYGAAILPVDSEHNALFQGLAGHDWDEATSLVLTASGGPFRDKEPSFLASVTPEQALDHPNWSMGAKISIDSATLMNKGLEVIEAHHLFGIDLDRIQVLVHPESIVHSLVEYCDGSILAHMGLPDMRIPIAYCLSYPQRLRLDLPCLDLKAIGRLTFEEPDTDRFPCLDLAKQALKSGPSYPVVLNAANEVAVQQFLEKRIAFQDIARLNRDALEAHSVVPIRTIGDIFEVDRKVRERLAQSA
jgi:1-deoxy-D-xylulose-5-phosphate reductoisomerase